MGKEMKKYNIFLILICVYLLSSCTLTYTGSEIIEKANQARFLKSKCNKMIEKKIPILYEQDLYITNLDLVSIKDIKDFNYQNGRIKIELELTFCGNPVWPIPDYAQNLSKFIISGAPDLIREEDGKSIYLKDLRLESIINCDNFSEPLSTICEKNHTFVKLVTNTLIKIFSKDVAICKFTGFLAYMVDDIYISNDGIKVKWSLL